MINQKLKLFITLHVNNTTDIISNIIYKGFIKMPSIKIFLFYLVIFVASIAYNRYKINTDTTLFDNYELVKKYLLNDKTRMNTRKPFIWIFIDHEKNNRNWSSWGSRSSMYLNQPYLHLCIRSIIEHCGKSFNVVLLDDKAFNRLIPNWTIPTETMPSPLKHHLRDLAMAKVLQKYGGMTVPASFICLKNLSSLYLNMLKESNQSVFVSEFPSYMDEVPFFPSSKIMGCRKNSTLMMKYVNYLENIATNDYTNEYKFLNQSDRWFYKCMLSDPHQLSIVDGTIIGTKTENGKAILTEDLISEEDVDFSHDMYGIYIPSDQILNRTAFQWFARLSVTQVLTSNTVIGKYLLISNDI
jgi:hypothetical protein